MTPASERARLVQQLALENGYFLARLMAPKTASRAKPGHRIRLLSNPCALSEPLFLMRADSGAGWIEVLYQADTSERLALSQQPRASTFDAMLDESSVWELPTLLERVLVLADQTHLAPAVFLADILRKQGLSRLSLVLLELTCESPFRPRPSHIMVAGMPAGVIAAMPLLEDWSVPSRLASHEARPGCFDGSVADLAGSWLCSMHENPANLVLATAGIETASIAVLRSLTSRVFPITHR